MHRRAFLTLLGGSAFAGVLVLSAYSTAAAAFSNCNEFRARLAAAEAQLRIPVPRVVFKELESLPGLGVEFDLGNVQGFVGQLNCRHDGRFDFFQVQQNQSDDYSSRRFVNLLTAAIWAFADWPKEKIDAAVKRVLVELDRKIKDNRVRGGSIEDDRVYIDLSDDELTNVQVGGGRKHGLYFLVDDSVRD